MVKFPNQFSAARRGFVIACCALAVGTATAQVNDGPAAFNAVVPKAAPDVFGGWSSNHIIVQARSGVVPRQTNDGRWTFARVAGASTSEANTSKNIAVATKRRGVLSISPLFTVRPANKTLAAKYGLERFYRVSVPTGSDAKGMAAEFAKFTKLIEQSEVDGIGGIATEPNDPKFEEQWGMQNTGQFSGTPDADIDADEAWDIAQGSASTIVALLDTGAQSDHPDLLGRITLGPPTLICNPDAPVGDVTKCTSTNSYDVHGHGTHCAGTIAANANNSVGISGLNWNCQILAIRVVNADNGQGSEAEVANGIIYATDNGADIISMSLQYYTGTLALQNAVAYAWDSGVLPVAASGNFKSAGTIAYPGKFPKCMCIAASTRFDQIWIGSNSGPEVDVAAPGAEIHSTTKNSGYQNMSGTSMATPHVAGVASLIKGLNPSLGPAEIEAILKDTAEDKGTPGFDNSFGVGRINAHNALLSMLPKCPGNLNGDSTVDVDDLLSVINNWGACDAPPAECPADLSPIIVGNGVVDVDDLLTVINNWGDCP